MSEIQKTIDGINVAWEQFKQANDQRLAAIEKTGEEVSELREKTERIDAAMTELENLKSRLEKAEIRMDTPEFSKGKTGDAERKVLDAFDKMVRSAKEGSRDFNPEAVHAYREANKEYLACTKAVSIGTTTAGGHAVPEVISRMIDQKLLDISNVLPEIKVVNVGTSDYKELVDVRGSSSGWVGEDGNSPLQTRSATNTPTIQQVAPTFGIVYAYPKATEESIQDIFFNVQDWLVNAAAEDFAQAIGAAVIAGSGTNRPTGFISGTPAPVTTADGSRTFGTLQYIPTGKAGALPDPFNLNSSPQVSTPQGNFLLTTVYTLKAGYRSNAKWAMEKATLLGIRKFRDGDGAYYWQPSLQAGQPSTLLGYPILEWEDMPSIGSNTFPIAFGDFRAAYTFCNRVGTSITVDDNITAPGWVKYYIRRRVGGILRNDDAIKVVKCAAS